MWTRRLTPLWSLKIHRWNGLKFGLDYQNRCKRLSKCYYNLWKHNTKPVCVKRIHVKGFMDYITQYLDIFAHEKGFWDFKIWYQFVHAHNFFLNKNYLTCNFQLLFQFYFLFSFKEFPISHFEHMYTMLKSNKISNVI